MLQLFKTLKKKNSAIRACTHDVETIDTIPAREVVRNVAKKMEITLTDSAVDRVYYNADVAGSYSTAVCLECGEVGYSSNRCKGTFDPLDNIVNFIRKEQATNRRRAKAFELYDKGKNKL